MRPWIHPITGSRIYEMRMERILNPLILAELLIAVVRIFTQSMFSFISTLSLIQPLIICSVKTGWDPVKCQVPLP